jgi:serum/glucocorticoid-regulated kinase 2
VKLNYSFQSSGYLYLVMDCMPGGDLYYILKREGCFPEHTCRVIIAEVLLAIKFLHDYNVMYRDLKPENVLIAEDGHIKISDFGLSKIVEGKNLSYTVAGTTDYIAPEILSGKGYNQLIDLWSLGVLLFELSHGYPPFRASEEEIRSCILAGKYQTKDGLSPQCVDLIARLLQLSPASRLGAESMDELQEHPWFEGVDWAGLMNGTV